MDLKVTLVDGATHDVDSNDLAFRFAAGDALRKAVQEAGSVLLEPIMRIEIVTPEDYLGNITADLSSRRALIDHTSNRGKLMVIDARAPLEKMFGYSTAVRSLSQGRAGYTMEPLEYAAAPGSMLEAIAVCERRRNDVRLELRGSWLGRETEVQYPRDLNVFWRAESHGKCDVSGGRACFRSVRAPERFLACTPGRRALRGGRRPDRGVASHGSL